MCAAWYDEDVRRRLSHSADYYWYEEGRWYGSDLFGLWDYLSRPGCKMVKFGRMIGDAQYRAVMSQAIVVCRPGTPLAAAARAMTERRSRSVVVVAGSARFA